MAAGSPRALPDRPTVVVLRALPGLGDWLCVVPTLRALRSARPEARVHLVGLPATLPLVRRERRLVDAFHAFPGWPGLPDRPVDVAAIPGVLAAIQGLEADIALQLQGSGETTNQLVELFGAAHVAGFARPGVHRPDQGSFLTWHDTEPEVRRGLRLLRALGLPATDDRLSFPLDPGARSAASALLAEIGSGGEYAVVHPGGRRAGERWPAAGFVALGRELAGQGLAVVVTGDAGERGLTAAVAGGIPGALDAGGRTGLDELGWLLRGATLVVSNDTGVAHLADALAARSLVVFGSDDGTRAARWAPLDVGLHRAVSGSVEEVSAAMRLALRSAGRRLPTAGWTAA